MDNLPTLNFPMLDSMQWQNSKKQAANMVNNKVTKPNRKDFYSEDRSPYPKLLTGGLTIALLFIMAFTFAFSSTKQIIATSQVVDSLSTMFGISQDWLNATAILWLFAGEIGALVFSIGAAIFPGEPVVIFNRSIRPFMWIFRFASISCAGVAVLANVAVTQLDPNSSIPVYQWVVTFAAPMLVLAIGLFFERMILAYMVDRKENQLRYELAKMEYDKVVSDPENHKDYHTIHRQIIWDMLTKVPKRRDLLRQYTQVDEKYMLAIVETEETSHELWSGTSGISLRATSANPLS